MALESAGLSLAAGLEHLGNVHETPDCRYHDRMASSMLTVLSQAGSAIAAYISMLPLPNAMKAAPGPDGLALRA